MKEQEAMIDSNFKFLSEKLDNVLQENNNLKQAKKILLKEL